MKTSKNKAMKDCFLGIDTSNYTTSLSLVCDGEVIANVRKLLPVKNESAGLRQSDAVFLHTKALPALSGELFSEFDFDSMKLRAVGVSSKPRDVEGSYMPCFLAGLSFACAISSSHNIPLYEFSHQAGHIASAIYSCNARSTIFENTPFISFHISGGTTEALYTIKTKDSFSCEIIGGTSDASCGQIIDRAGVLMGMDFPCGKELDLISLDSKKALPLCTSVKGNYFSMSGLENKVQHYLSTGESKSDIACFLFNSIGKTLEKVCLSIRQKHGDIPLLFAGGVMSNTKIRSILGQIPHSYFASTQLSSDNAAGIALLTCKKHTESGK